MGFKNTLEHYGMVAKALHWLMALLIICMLAIGLRMTGLENGPDKFWVYGLHKSFGMVVLALASMRLGWKVLNVAPTLPGTMGCVSKLAAKAAHGLLYLLMFAMPISGWVMSSSAGFSVSVFGWFVLPDLVAPDKEFSKDMATLHGVLAWGLMGIIMLHVAGALLHHFYYRDNVLRRMLPFTRRSSYAQDSDTNTGC